MIHAAVSLGVHLVLIVLLLFVFKAGIYSVIIAYMVFGLVMAVLNLHSVYKVTGYLPDPLRTIALPAGAAFFMGLVCFVVSFIFSRFVSGKLMNLLIVLLAIVAVVGNWLRYFQYR